MYVLSAVLFVGSLLFACDAAFVDTLHKCSVKDDECLKNLYQNIIQNIGKDGIPELDIPSIDPMRIKNLSLTVLDSIKVTISKGVIKGIKSCVFNNFHFDWDKLTGIQDFTCDLTVKGEVEVSGTSPAAQALLGTGSINGHGKGKVKLDKLKLNYVFPFTPFKKEDGQTYIKIAKDKIKYTYDLEKASFAAEKVYIGQDDISKFVENYLNENWKNLFDSLGAPFLKTAPELYSSILDKFLTGVPVNKYLIEDVTTD